MAAQRIRLNRRRANRWIRIGAAVAAAPPYKSAGVIKAPSIGYAAKMGTGPAMVYAFALCRRMRVAKSDDSATSTPSAVLISV